MTAAAEPMPGGLLRAGEPLHPGEPLRPGGLWLTDHAIDLAGLPSGSVVWDLGCGTGATVRHLAGVRGLRAAGVDRSPEAVAEARALAPDGTFVVGSAASLPCADAALDGVLLECSWSLAEPGFGRVRPDPVLAEAHRALRPGGALIVTDLYDGPDPRRPRPIGAVPLPTADDLRAAAARHGFEVTAFEDRTVALRSYVAQVLFDGGSLAALLGSERACGPFGAGLAAARPGYFLMVARRGS